MAATRQTVQSNASTNVKTSIFEKISYGMGDVACNVVFALTSGLITYFYTNVMSVLAAMVGMIMLISRIFDGISDVAIGLIMDKVHSKHGRGRAWVPRPPCCRPAHGGLSLPQNGENSGTLWNIMLY